MRVVSYGKTTSNHNLSLGEYASQLVVSYGKTTSNHNAVFYIAFLVAGCILWKNYIKPQPSPRSLFPYCVVSYGKTTSNHNWRQSHLACPNVVSYGKTTSNHNCPLRPMLFCKVVSYGKTTSNHNCLPTSCASWWLYLMEKLHQTTTKEHSTSI